MAFHIVNGRFGRNGFTLIELLVVMVIIATLLSIVTPRYLGRIDDAREAALKANLAQLREAIDHFHADRGVYPRSLPDLVETRYLRSIPVDPITESAQTWQVFPPPGKVETEVIFDIRSGAQGASRRGESYANW